MNALRLNNGRGIRAYKVRLTGHFDDPEGMAMRRPSSDRRVKEGLSDGCEPGEPQQPD